MIHNIVHLLKNHFMAGVVCTLMSMCVTGNSDFVSLHDTRMSMNVDSVEKLASMYPKSAQEVRAWCDVGVKLAQQELDVILSHKVRTFDNTVRALDLSEAKLSHLAAIFELFDLVSPESDMRDAARESAMIMKQMSIDLYMNPQLYQALQDYHDNHSADEALTAENCKLLQDSLDACKRQGLHLPEQILAQVKQLYKELDQLAQDFMTNISNDIRQLVVSGDDLQGLSESVINRLNRQGDLYVLTNDFPTCRAVMEQCHIAQTRHDMFMMYGNGAYPVNEQLLTQILQKRDQLAQLLGYDYYAQMDIATTSAKTEVVVEKFLTDLAQVAAHKTEQEIVLLKTDLPQSVQLREDGSLNPWDYWYAVTEYKKKYFAIDEVEISTYFPTQKVVDGMLQIYQDFLGLTFKQVKPVWTWHEDVQLIEIYRQATQELLGYIFLDLYPRPYKFQHTGALLSQKKSYQIDGQNSTSIGIIIANFPPASGDNPPLLTHDAVVTFFHEFGHAMHQVLGRTEHHAYAGTNVKSDFVETPSQMFEQWMLEPEILAQISGHYVTGEQLPADLIRQKLAIQNFNEGYFTLRQCVLSLFALELMQQKEFSYQPGLLWESVYKKYLVNFLGYESGVHGWATFFHLADAAYACKYYSYLWTNVFACDLYSEIKKHEFNDEYRNKVIRLLSVGGSVSPQILLQEFLGREPNQEAFLMMLGLK